MSGMKILHTADWHAGRTLAGQDRTPEIDASLQRLVSLARDEMVHAVVVAGDLFDSATPSAAAEAAVYRFFRSLREHRIPAAVIAGNHDSPSRIDALANLLSLGNVTAVGHPRPGGKGGVFAIPTSHQETPLYVAAAPFVSPRRLVRAKDLIEQTDDEQRATYQGRLRTWLANLSADMPPGYPNVLAFHGTMNGATLSSEFAFHSTEAFALEAGSIPDVFSYGAFGHIHMPQDVQGFPDYRAQYCGSLITLDFSEAGQDRGAMVVTFDGNDVEEVVFHPIRAAKPLEQIDTTLDKLEGALRERNPSAWLKLRISMDEPRHGLKERLHREVPDLLIAEFVLPEHEAGEPERIDVGEIDFVEAYRAWSVDQKGSEPSREMAEAFAEIERETSPDA